MGRRRRLAWWQVQNLRNELQGVATQLSEAQVRLEDQRVANAKLRQSQLKATKALRRERLAADRLKVSTSYCYASVSSFS